MSKSPSDPVCFAETPLLGIEMVSVVGTYRGVLVRICPFDVQITCKCDETLFPC